MKETNEQLIHRFYTAFQSLDYKTMQDCYHDDVVFNDPVFGILQSGEPQAMWEMLCKRASDFSLSFNNITIIDEEYATCEWTATYLFSASKRKVVNHIKAHFRIINGKISEHTDSFNLYNWAKQALGLPGVVLGWTPWMQQKIKNNAKMGLRQFMKTR